MRSDVGLHFEVLVWSPAAPALREVRVGSVVYSGGEVAWDKIVSAERRWLFERLEAALCAWVGPDAARAASAWRLVGALDAQDAPCYQLAAEATEAGEASAGGWALAAPAWADLAPRAREDVLAALGDVLDHVEALLTIL